MSLEFFDEQRRQMIAAIRIITDHIGADIGKISLPDIQAAASRSIVDSVGARLMRPRPRTCGCSSIGHVQNEEIKALIDYRNATKPRPRWRCKSSGASCWRACATDASSRSASSTLHLSRTLRAMLSRGKRGWPRSKVPRRLPQRGYRGPIGKIPEACVPIEHGAVEHCQRANAM